MKRIALGLRGGMAADDLVGCRQLAAGIRLPIACPIFPEFVGYLPNPASRDGIRHTAEAFANA